jgi:hypothetical protein
MKQIETTQITYGKATIKQIKQLLPNAIRTIKSAGGRVIKDKNNKTLGTWHPPMLKSTNKNGLIVIH